MEAPSRERPAPIVYISYSRRDKEWRDAIERHLAPFETRGEISVWHDQKIAGGDDWNQETERALEEADAAILLVSAHSLESKFIQEKEVPRFLEKRAESDFKLIPVLVSACAWQELDWLASIQMIPKDAQPLNEMLRSESDSVLASMVREIVNQLQSISKSRTNKKSAKSKSARKVQAGAKAATANSDFADSEGDRLSASNSGESSAIEVTTSKGAARPVNAASEAFVFSDSAKDVLKLAKRLGELSKRGGITSSCVLFALAESSSDMPDTAWFVRHKLDSAGRYEAAKAEFMSDGRGFKSHPISAEAWLGNVSHNVENVLESARSFALRISKNPEIYRRHLFAALLLSSIENDELGVYQRFDRLGLNVHETCVEFRDFLRRYTASTADDWSEWDRVLNVPIGSGTKPAGQPPEPPPISQAEAYVCGPAGYSAEFCGVGGAGPIADHLGVQSLAERLAELIALRETKLPLAVGLFGDWGSGKSHFMNLIDRHLKSLAAETPEDWARRAAQPGVVARPDPTSEGPWCREIVPIYFNAWHYLDSNLWASLVSEIFERLFASLSPKADQLTQVQELLREAGGATARAEEEVARAQAAAEKASSDLKKAVEKSEAARSVFDGLLDNLLGLLPDLRMPAEQARIADLLGVRAEVATLSQLTQKRGELMTLGGQVKELWQRITAVKGRPYRIGWLVAAIGIGPAILWGAAQLLPTLEEWLKQATPIVRGGLQTVAAVGTALVPFFVEVQRRTNDLRGLMTKAEEAQQSKSKTKEVQEADQNVITCQNEVAKAKGRLAEAIQREEQLKKDELELAPARRISRFIEERAQSADYRGQLGLVSLARRDFQALSDLFADAEALNRKKAVLPPEEANELQRLSESIDRIVLFVDDLDRCQPEKVVDVLQAVHLLLAFPLFTVVVGVDQRCLRQSLRMQFKGLISPDGERANGKPELQSRLPEIGHEEQLATPLDYLEKIFHVPFHLPPMGQQGFAKLIDRLTESAKATTPERTETTPLEELPRTGADVGSGTVAWAAESSKVARPGSLPAAQHVPDMDGGAVSVGGKTVSLGVAAPAGEIGRVIGSVPLQAWERKALQDYHVLIRTPRGATRLLNTYRLVRAGIAEEEWETFRGDGSARGEFRVMMLLLASAAGYPAFARGWFEHLRSFEDEIALTEPPPGTSAAAWTRFKHVYETTLGELEPEPSGKIIRKWLDQVERFAF